MRMLAAAVNAMVALAGDARIVARNYLDLGSRKLRTILARALRRRRRRN